MLLDLVFRDTLLEDDDVLCSTTRQLDRPRHATGAKRDERENRHALPDMMAGVLSGIAGGADGGSREGGEVVGESDEATVRDARTRAGLYSAREARRRIPEGSRWASRGGGRLIEPF